MGWLLSSDDAGLNAGTNAAVIGSEVFQFGDVLPLGEGRFRLSRLLRGRAGTEWAMGAHAVGDTFVLLSASSLASVAMPAWSIGTAVEASAENLSGRTSSASISLTGESVRPPSPVAVQAVRTVEGDLSISWTRRTFAGLEWSGSTAPLGTGRELYQISLAGTASSSSLEATEPRLVVAADAVAILGTGTLAIEVRQVGDLVMSHPGTCEVNI